PRFLAGCGVLALDLVALLAGARYRGDLEERVQRVLDGLAAASASLGAGSDGAPRRRVVLFVDEVHLLVAPGGSGQSAGELASLLKPALGRRGLACIGATTVEEYRRHLERDGAFERRFQPLFVDEPDDAA